MSAGLQDSIFNLFVYGPNGLTRINSREPFGKPYSGTRVNRPTNDSGQIASDKFAQGLVNNVGRLSSRHPSLNFSDAVELLERAENAVIAITEKLNQLVEIVQQANEDEAIVEEVLKNKVNNLVSEIDDIALDTKYKNLKILDGSLVTGVGSGFRDFYGNEILVKIDSARISRLGLVTSDSSIQEYLRGGGADKALEIVKNSIASVNLIKYDINSYQGMLSELIGSGDSKQTEMPGNDEGGIEVSEPPGTNNRYDQTGHAINSQDVVLSYPLFTVLV